MSVAILLLALACTFVAIQIRRKHQKQPPLPPGPPADPFIGHLRKIPPDHQENAFYRLGKLYGDVLYLHVLGRPIVVLNSVEAAVDLLDKRSANYSDRPRFIIFEIMGWIRSLTFTGYGKEFHKYRKMIQEPLKASKSVSYQPIQAQQAHILLQNILNDQEGRDNHLSRFSTAIILRLAYGHHIASDDDPYIGIAQRTSHALSNAGPSGNTPVDLFPFLAYLPSWFPGTYYAKFARENKHVIDELRNYPFDNVQKALASGKAKRSVISDLLDSLSPDEAKNPDILEDIKGTASVMYCAGAETTWATLSFFFLAMVLHPECQRRAQQEIDSVVGTGRLPEFSDRESLPYVEGILQETYRWHNTVPLGVPHVSLEDDIYRGMFIPKGSLVIANARAMTLDERVYRNPFGFDPSRYLPVPQGNNEPHPIGAFGFGRRICPGRHLADASVWIAIASILATFDIMKAIGTDGNEITPEVVVTSGISSQPGPFKCRINPRNPNARNLIIQTDTWEWY